MKIVWYQKLKDYGLCEITLWPSCVKQPPFSTQFEQHRIKVLSTIDGSSGDLNGMIVMLSVDIKNEFSQHIFEMHKLDT